MNAVLKLIAQGEAFDAAKLADILALPKAEVDRQLADLQKQGILLGWRPVLNPEFEAANCVRAMIEVCVRPEDDFGFDRLADRISSMEHVESCYLMSGSYDLLVVLKESNLQRIADFVHKKLARLPGVQSTATRFMLRAYKEQGCHIGRTPGESDRPAYSA